MKTRPVVILAIVVLAIIAIAMWFLQLQPEPKSAPIGVITPTPAPSTPVPEIIARFATPVPAATPSARRELVQKPLAEWELRIDQVLRTNAGETETAQMLINMLPSLPPDGQAEAAQHIANLILDKDYNRVLPLLRNPSLPEQVQDVLVTDLMNRDDSVKLPALLDVAKIPNHPYQAEALTDLQIFLDQDNGTNWAKWDSALQAYQAKQAQAAAANQPPAAPTTPPAQ